MVLRILDVSKQLFRPDTWHVYPPFKNGRYIEEYVYEYLTSKKEEIKTDLVYIPVFWTNVQLEPGFFGNRNTYNLLLQSCYDQLPSDTKYFTVAQHDDGPLLTIPPNTIVFGACKGTIPLPLIYEDINETLLHVPRIPFDSKDLLASFIGTSTTHPIRQELASHIRDKKNIYYFTRPGWTFEVKDEDKSRFIEMTMKSKFCLSPRGYSPSSFRFFEAMLMDVIPVYFWDDIEWLPYKEILDYSKFSLSIHKNEIGDMENKLRQITEEKYLSMIDELKRVRHYFTLEGICEYVVKKITEV